MPTRRSFLRTSGLTLATMGTVPSWLLRAAAQGSERGKILIAVFQRGAADGLNIVVPFSETRYYALRPTLAVAQPGAEGGAIDLDGRFGLHPALQPLKDLWDEGHLALIPAAGSPDPTRSHFDAQEYMECGTPGVKREDGWLNRALPVRGDTASPMQAVAMGPQLPRTLRGSRGAVAIDDLSRFDIGSPETAGVLEALYASATDPLLRAQGGSTFDAARLIDSLRTQPYTPAAGAQYVGRFGQRLLQIARLIKADAGVEVAFADIGDWDHHRDEAPQLANRLFEFGTSLAAFVRDMGSRMSDIVVVTMSEFGRTAAENGSAGTDHGRGNVMMVLGGPVRGGAIYGGWPGLEPEQLFERRELAITTDFRDVLGELVQVHLGQDPGVVFPGHAAHDALGLLRG
jgi:uncharacterized protein (DUF1501 family)